MDAVAEIMDVMINSYTDPDELMDFATTMGIQDSVSVRLRLFQLRQQEYDNEFIEEQMDMVLQTLGGRIQTPVTFNEDDMGISLEYVQIQEEIDGAVKALLFDDDMNETARLCLEDGDWDDPFVQTGGGEEPRAGPSGLQNDLFDDDMNETARLCLEDGDWDDPFVQTGGGEEPRAGPSGLQNDNKLKYTMRKKATRTYAKNAAIDTTYQVKLDERYNGQRLIDVRQGLHDMIQAALNEARGHLQGNDLGRVVIHHDALHNPVVVPLQKWDTLDANRVMEILEKVLNSNQELSIDETFDIIIGTIDLPKGGKRKHIIRIKGENTSLDLKRSVVAIENEDKMCMARAIGVSWAKLKRCTKEEWEEVTKNRQGKSNLELILEYQIAPLSYYNNLVNKKKKHQGQLARALCKMAGVPIDRTASLNDVEAFEEILGVRVMVISARLGNKFITSPSSDERPCIYVYLVDDDHFHAITNITGFFSDSYFCEKCLKHYSNREYHQCAEKCIVCKRDHCPKTNQTLRCTDCNMDCRSDDCYKQHKKVPLHKNGRRKGQPSGPSQCEKWWRCFRCYKVLKTDIRKKEDHVCGEYFCKTCKKYVLDDHQCYLRAKECKDKFIPKYIFFDFECSQDDLSECENGYIPQKKIECADCQPSQVCKSCSKCKNCNTSWCGRTTHRPNFVLAHSVCPKCIDNELTAKSVCKRCGSRCKKCQKNLDEKDLGPCPGTCGFREVTFQGHDTAEQFGQWLFTEQHEYCKVVAHNMKGYDGYFLLEYLVDQSLRPDKIIYNGSKIMYMTVERDLHIKVIDSLNFLPMKLSALPKAFGLHELKKGWFLHYFNTRENQNYVGPYPDAKDYGYDFMGEKERSELVEWLKQRQCEVFDFRKEMLEYCRSDVDILRQACLKFRYLLMNATGEEKEVINGKGKTEKRWFGAVDPFDSVTIASVCMNVFRSKFLEEKWKVQLYDTDEWIPAKLCEGVLYVLVKDEWVSAAKLKVKGKEFVSTPIAKIPPSGYKEQYSKVSIQWLEWRALTDHVHIQHALNEGEKKIPGTRYKLDGYCEETHTAYEYHGCVFHGCPVCFPDKREDTYHPLTNQSLNELYALTLKKKAYLEQLGMKYVCIWDHDFKKLKDENEELKECIAQLDVADRLDPRESFFGGRTNASQLYYKTKEHEQVRYVDFTSLYPWVNKYCRYPVGHPKILTKDFGKLEEYFGIAKIKTLPPRGLYHPVLPYRSNGKLKFPLCRTCADTENQDSCTCSSEDRVLIGTWCIPEIKTALRLGYTLEKIYEVYHWEETTQYNPETGDGGLFAKYINTFLKFKQEASGPPDWVKTKQDMTKYMEDYHKKEGVLLDQNSIVKNPGKRALAKLCLNSFWGKFGQRLNMRQTKIYHESQANLFFQVFSDPTKEPLNFHILSNDMIQIEWIYKHDFQPEDNETNIYLATFTTCWARLKLYSVLEKLNKRVLYYDTDSVIYVSRPGEFDPPLGDYLGELTDELEQGEHIVEFVSGGPKNYAYKTSTNEETCKVRGFTLNYTNSKLINFEAVKAIVTDSKSSSNIVVTNPCKICRDKRKRKLYNREEKKSYQMVYTKQRKLDNYDTVPYGYD